MASLVEASAARSVTALEAASKECANADMMLFSKIAARQAIALRGHTAELERADESLRSLGVEAPARLAAALAPF